MNANATASFYAPYPKANSKPSFAPLQTLSFEEFLTTTMAGVPSPITSPSFVPYPNPAPHLRSSLRFTRGVAALPPKSATDRPFDAVSELEQFMAAVVSAEKPPVDTTAPALQKPLWARAIEPLTARSHAMLVDVPTTELIDPEIDSPREATVPEYYTASNPSFYPSPYEKPYPTAVPVPAPMVDASLQQATTVLPSEIKPRRCVRKEKNPGMTVDLKNALRMERNRASARKSRQRMLDRIKFLEEACARLTEENQSLKQRLGE